MRKWIAIILLVILLSLVGLKVYLKMLEEGSGIFSGRRGQAVAVELAPFRRTTIRDVGAFTGSLKSKARFLLAPKTAGRLERLLVNIGDELKHGQLVAELDDSEYQQQLEQARALLEVARANSKAAFQSLAIAAREINRIKSLREQKIATVSELDAARAEYTSAKVANEVAKAQLTEKEAAFKLAQIRLSHTRIHALWRDRQARMIVGERFVDEGALLSINTPIVSLLDISSLVAVIHVTEKEYYKLNAGQPVLITAEAIPGRQMKGRITRIAPLIKESSREAMVEVAVDNPGNILKPGLFVRAEIEFATHRNVVVVPQSAIVERNGETGVFVADLQERKALFRRIQPGIVSSEQVEVVSPALAGEVVTVGHHLLQDGSAILVPGRENGSPAQAEQGGPGKGGRPKG